VLSAGGRHVFSIPVWEPIPPLTVARVDTSADDDVHLLEPEYHHAPRGGLSLVYNDFGLDLLDRLGETGFETSILHLEGRGPEVAQLVTFVSRKPL
jgi:hypothetical protein